MYYLKIMVGGKIESGETGIEAAYRELFEETSISKALHAKRALEVILEARFNFIILELRNIGLFRSLMIRQKLLRMIKNR